MRNMWILLCSLLLFSQAATAQALTRSEVEKNLICYACPGEPLNIDRCGGGDQMRAEIDRRLSLGQNKETILEYFVQKFGDTILTAPPQKGFNLVAYAAPFVGLLIGLVVAVMFVWKWATAGKISRGRGDEDAEGAALYRDMEKQVEDELEKLEND